MYYETLSRDNAALNAQVHVFDIEFQERSSLGARHDLIWSAGYHSTTDSTSTSSTLSLVPSSLGKNLSSIFLQDDIVIMPGRPWYTSSIRFHSTHFTACQSDPSVRL